MKKVIGFCLLLSMLACTSKDKKVESINTKLDDSQTVSPNTNVGTTGEGDLVYQHKTDLVNELVTIQDEVNELQDKVYGNPDYDSKGLYGKVLECRKKKALKTGELSFIPDKTPVIDEDQMRVGKDSQTKKLIGYTEENLQKRLTRFKDYKKTLYARQDELDGYIEKCEVELSKSGK
jgi:hypothetical protein